MRSSRLTISPGNKSDWNIIDKIEGKNSRVNYEKVWKEMTKRSARECGGIEKGIKTRKQEWK